MSLATQGMRNGWLNFGLFFETALGAVMCYTPGVNYVLQSKDIYWRHYGIPAFPFFF